MKISFAFLSIQALHYMHAQPSVCSSGAPVLHLINSNHGLKTTYNGIIVLPLMNLARPQIKLDEDCNFWMATQGWCPSIVVPVVSTDQITQNLTL